MQEFRARADQRGQDTGASPIIEQGDRQHKQVEVGGSVPPPRTTLRRRPAGKESHRLEVVVMSCYFLIFNDI